MHTSDISSVTHLLTETLLLAVPMWINDLRPSTSKQLQTRASQIATILASQGDTLMFKGKTKDQRQATTLTFNALAEGLAIGAYNPGGITFGGYHWCIGSQHMGIRQDHTGPCDAAVAREADGL